MKKIKVAVIGYGGMGCWHSERITEMEQFELAGVWDINAHRLELARDHGFHTFSSIHEIWDDESIELVVIATWNDEHKPLVIEALHHGKNVISEKPVTITVADLEDMIAASEKAGKLFTVHQNRRWDDDYLTAVDAVRSNRLGKVFRIESRVQGSRGIPGDWRGVKLHGGGMIFDWGVHLFDQALTLNDKNPLVSVWAKKTNVTNVECDDGFYAELTFADGLSYYVEVTTNNFISLPRWYILGENGTTVIEDWALHGKSVLIHDWDKMDAVPIQAGAGLTKTMAPRTPETIREEPLVPVHGQWIEYYGNIYDVLTKGEKQIVSHRQMLRCLSLIEAVFDSAEHDRVVAFDDRYVNKD